MNMDPHRRARVPRLNLCMVPAAQRTLLYLTRPSHPLTRLWMITAAARSRSDLSLSRSATWPARKNTLVFPKQYWSVSGMSSGRYRLHKAWAWAWLWGPRRRIRYLLKNSSYVHLNTNLPHIYKTLSFIYFSIRNCSTNMQFRAWWSVWTFKRPGWITCGTDPNSLQHSTCSQLLHGPLRVEPNQDVTHLCVTQYGVCTDTLQSEHAR